MVISHKYKYVFVELPRTGTTAISKQLVEHYAGEEILIKHATYRNFKQFYKNKYDDYFVFSCVRNPLDRTVSLYEKLKNKGNDYLSVFKNNLSYNYFKKRIDFIKKNDSFEDYFLKFYKLPYDDWGSLDHKKLDYLIRFENLQEDFSKVLEILKIKQKELIPFVNKTKSKKDYKSYYITSKVKKRALFIFNPYCKKFGYNLEESKNTDSSLGNIIYKNLYVLRKYYWIYSKNYIITKRIKQKK